ncbi:hypothetical protein chiPu_0004982 [Chiloscyllium punctatum]|uniref:Uncharacterized protein n=1 Tax=Chiloscyllium punctatum TaxID=137246 RepID=A0A401S844_CHIPU|nr:hypothetical protein [Chiloscyllium punctatum]
MSTTRARLQGLERWNTAAFCHRDTIPRVASVDWTTMSRDASPLLGNRSSSNRLTRWAMINLEICPWSGALSGVWSVDPGEKQSCGLLHEVAEEMIMVKC